MFLDATISTLKRNPQTMIFEMKTYQLNFFFKNYEMNLETRNDREIVLKNTVSCSTHQAMKYQLQNICALVNGPFEQLEAGNHLPNNLPTHYVLTTLRIP